MSSHGSSCGACKFLRRKCIHGCIFAPYFCHDEGAAHFAAIHRIFGASNVSKLLSHLPVHCRSEAAITISYEAQARVRDPIYGCVAHIFALQQQVANLQEEIELLTTHAGHPMAEVVGYGSSQLINGISDFQFSSQQDDLMNFRDPSDQQVPPSVNGNHAFNSGDNLQMPPLQREDMDKCSEFANDPNSSLERLCLDVDPQVLPNGPWFDHVIYPSY
ncbi:LOB domain-containing protein 29-like [Magnolia sinica]|uniref:LOB domain-containing protein 29-like n=1 Tax=Magnolia sinica TaxID=86752 RepID=UPI0026591D54|nr:LOB domain-containing protein 29-like [Magnolia sinica]